MTTSQKLWLGFGTLTALLLVVCVAVFVRVRSIERLVQEQSHAARPRSAAARELEINVLGYALAVRTYLLTDDPKLRTEAQADAEAVEHHLADYRRLAVTDRQRKLAADFTDRWTAYRVFGDKLLDSKDRPLRKGDSDKLTELRTGLEKFLDDEMQRDAVESYEASRDAALRDVQAVLGFVLLLLLVGVAVAVVTSGAVGRAVVRGERVVAEQGERLRTTLASIGDAVITTDTAGRTTNMNAVAESLTGWANADAVDQPLDVVFNIVNEGTRKTVEKPVFRALKEGVIVGLANHTVLIRKDGTERPIDDSAAPIRCKEGEVVGCVLVFRDITERHRAEETLRFQLDLTKSITDNATIAIFMMDDKSRCTFMNPAAERMTGFTLKEVEGGVLHDFIHHHRPDGRP